MVGLFVVAAAVTAVAIPPSLTLGGRTGPDAYAGRRIGRDGRDRGDRCRRIRRRWPRRARTRPRPLTRRPTSRSASTSERQAATGPAGQPGTIRVVVGRGRRRPQVGGHDRADRAARTCSAKPNAGGLGRPRRPDADPGQAGRRGARAPPAHRRGRPRGQPAGQDRDDRRRRPHRPVPPDLRRARRRVGARHRARLGLPADRPQRATGTRGPATTWRWRRTDPDARPGPPPVGDRRRPRRRLLPVRRPDRRRHRRRPGRGRAQGDAGHASSSCSSSSASSSRSGGRSARSARSSTS